MKLYVIFCALKQIDNMQPRGFFRGEKQGSASTKQNNKECKNK